MSRKVCVTLPGPEGSGDARATLRILERFLALLGHLEDNEVRKRATRAEDRSTWGITAIELGSLKTTLEPNRVRRGATVATLDRVASTAVDGFAEAEEREGLPRGWDGRTAEAGADLARMLGLLNTDGMILELIDGNRVIRNVTVTRHAAEHLGVALQERRHSIGSLIGRLDTISVHQRLNAGLWHERTGERVTVTFDPPQTDEITAALGKRVELAGRITRTLDDRLVDIRMRSVEILPDLNDGPQLTGLVGLDPNFTGGMDPADYLREIRSAS